MKYLALLLAVAGIARTADFNTGQAARLVIGQPTFTREDEGASERLVGGVSGLALVNNTLFVVDSNRVGATPQNNRVLIFRDLASMLPAPTAELPKDTGPTPKGYAISRAISPGHPAWRTIARCNALAARRRNRPVSDNCPVR